MATCIIFFNNCNAIIKSSIHSNYLNSTLLKPQETQEQFHQWYILNIFSFVFCRLSFWRLNFNQKEKNNLSS